MPRSISRRPAATPSPPPTPPASSSSRVFAGAGSPSRRSTRRPPGASGALETEGQEVSRDVVLQVPAVGRIQGVVTKADGSPAIGALVMLDAGLTTTVDNSGFYFFDRVPVGRHSVLATAAIGPDAGA